MQPTLIFFGVAGTERDFFRKRCMKGMDHNRENTNHTIPWTSSHTSSGSVFRGVVFGGPNTEPQEAFWWSNYPFKSGKTLMPNPSLSKQQTSEWTQAHDQLPSFRDPNRSAKFEVTFRPGGPHLKPTDPSPPKKRTWRTGRTYPRHSM